MTDFSSQVKTGRKKLVVLGTGWSSFAFLNAIDKKKFDVFVVSPRNHFLFTPLLASTTVGTLEFRYIYRPQRSCEGYVFTPVCHSVHRGVCLSACWDTTPHQDQAPPGPGTPPGADPPGPGTPPGSRPASRRLLLRTVRILLECILV